MNLPSGAAIAPSNSVGDSPVAQLRLRVRRITSNAALSCCLNIIVASAAFAQPGLDRFRMADEPRVSERVIEQEEWASELVFALGLADGLPEDPRPEDLFGLLCADRVADSGDRWNSEHTPLRVAVEAPRSLRPGEPIRLVVSLPATALYALTVNGLGPQRWVIDQRTVGHLDPSALGVAQAPQVVPLRAGPHELTAYLTHRARVDRVELAAYRPLCIAPAEGWRKGRPLTFATMARTIVPALGLERRLPVAGSAINVPGERYQTASAWGGRTNRILPGSVSESSAFESKWATAVGSPAEFSYRARVDEPGLYTLLVRVYGHQSQIWSLDGRHRVTVRPKRDAAGFDWAHVMTLHLDSGEHVVRALLPRGAGIDSLHLIPRTGTDSDYIAVLEAAGFGGGVPDQPVTQTDAYSTLSNPLFAEVSSRFRKRLAGDAKPAPWWIRRAEIESVGGAANAGL